MEGPKSILIPRNKYSSVFSGRMEGGLFFIYEKYKKSPHRGRKSFMSLAQNKLV
jgi:hypothetical protein